LTSNYIENIEIKCISISALVKCVGIILFIHTIRVNIHFTRGSGGGAPSAHPLTAADLRHILCPKRYFFSSHTLKMTFTLTFNTFNDFLPHPLPVDKVHAPPKVKSWTYINHSDCFKKIWDRSQPYLLRLWYDAVRNWSQDIQLTGETLYQ